MKLFTVLAAVIFISAVSPANALEAANPGKGLWGISLGSTRAKAIAIAQKRFIKAKRQKSHTYAKGLTEDGWVIPIGEESLRFEIFSVKGKVVQLRTWTSEKRGQTKLSFAQLIQRHRLQKSVYGFDDPQGGGYNCFYYDDVKRGVCFTAGVQDAFILTSRPDGIIIHRPGVPAIAIEDGTYGKPVTGRNARVFASEAEARRAEEHESNDY